MARVRAVDADHGVGVEWLDPNLYLAARSRFGLVYSSLVGSTCMGVFWCGLAGFISPENPGPLCEIGSYLIHFVQQKCLLRFPGILEIRTPNTASYSCSVEARYERARDF